MKKELEEALIRDFPDLYARKPVFDVADGWEPLIRELSAKLDPLGVVAFQVKEKFGGLRFYIDGGSDEAYDLIDDAADRSTSICEECGEPGMVRGHRWVRTLCDGCGGSE